MARILVVDDEGQAADGIRRLLEMDGYEAVALASPIEACEMLRAGPFDALVTDLEMPEMNGVALLETARAVRPGIVVIVMTAFDGTPICEQAMRAGARCIVAKPIDYELLLGELVRSLEHGRPSAPGASESGGGAAQ